MLQPRTSPPVLKTTTAAENALDGQVRGSPHNVGAVIFKVLHGPNRPIRDEAIEARSKARLPVHDTALH